MRITRFASMRAYVLILVAAGIATGSIALVLTAVVPLVFVLQGTLSTTPTVDGTVEINRELSPPTPLPGQPVEVTLTVKNTGERSISDLRLVDGVPEELGVTAGSPRAAGAVSAGGEFSHSYTLQADRGSYAFDDVAVRARNSNGTRLVDETLAATGETAFECQVDIEEIPLQQTTNYTGQLPTDTGGPGVEFYATRDHQPEDPVSRIDWRSYAKTGELATIDYREQHAAHITVLTDSRQPAHAAADPTSPTGATLSAYAATIALNVLISEGHEVSLGALGIVDPQTGTGPPAWVPPEAGTAFAAHATAVCNAAATGGGGETQHAEPAAEPGAAADGDDAAAADGSADAEAAYLTDGGDASTDEVDGEAGTNKTADSEGGSAGASDDNSESAQAGDTGSESTQPADAADEWRRVRSLVPGGAQVVLCTPATDEPVVDLVESLRGDGHEVTILSPQTTPATVGGRTVALGRAVRLEQLRLLGATVIDWDSDENLRSALARILGPGAG
ncbi:DUF58 domain-containing protein [Halonotius sp. F2-221B]|uniref:DUF58 domain-containing protein n=1 Tax=Halonotius sp. F2-221B TaxID=2731620 RepID=UPI00398A8E6F